MTSFPMHRHVAARNLQVVSLFAAAMLVLSSPALASTGVVAETNATSTAPQAPALEPASMPGTSSNWAGYVAEGGTYSGVNGSWAVPVPRDTAETPVAANATWVGIGGTDSRDLIQAGTQAIVQNGRVVYEAWYETLPDYQTRVPLAVRGGDSVSVSLTETSSDNWLLVFANNTTGKTYKKTISYASSRSSAEWIEEMPIGGSDRVFGYLPLDDFGTTYFTNAGAVVNGEQTSIKGTDASPLAMYTREGDGLATPSVLAADGASFTIARADSNLAEGGGGMVDPSDYGRGFDAVFYIVWQI